MPIRYRVPGSVSVMRLPQSFAVHVSPVSIQSDPPGRIFCRVIVPAQVLPGAKIISEKINNIIVLNLFPERGIGTGRLPDIGSNQ